MKEWISAGQRCWSFKHMRLVFGTGEGPGLEPRNFLGSGIVFCHSNDGIDAFVCICMDVNVCMHIDIIRHDVSHRQAWPAWDYTPNLRYKIYSTSQIARLLLPKINIPHPRLALFTAELLGHEVHREGFETSYNQNQNTARFKSFGHFVDMFGSFDVQTLVIRQIFVILCPHPGDVHVLEWMETYHPTTRDAAGKSAVNWHMDMENIRHL